MSLSIEIGSLAFQIEQGDSDSIDSVRHEFRQINDVLAEWGLPIHEEPESLPESTNRAAIKSFSYSVIHHLRRAYAYHLDSPNEPIEYLSEFDDPEEDILLDLEVDRMRSHLICHSDTEGYYVPVEFEDVVYDKSEERITGSYLGSSFALKNELTEIAPKLGINLSEGRLDDDQVVAINESVANKGPFAHEKMAWILLWESCRLSICHKTAIVFC